MAQRPNCAFPNEKLQAARTVLSAQDFYDYADEHFGWAETARTNASEQSFFKWRQLGLRSLKGGKLPQGGAPLSYSVVSIEAPFVFVSERGAPFSKRGSGHA